MRKVKVELELTEYEALAVALSLLGARQTDRPGAVFEVSDAIRNAIGEAAPDDLIRCCWTSTAARRFQTK